MKRMLLGVLVAGLIVGAVALSGGQKKPDTGNGDIQVQIDERNPWTHLRINNSQDMFHFAVVSDRTGGNRGRIFSQAVQQLNLLQPAFVISVGDLINGYSSDADKIGHEWREFQGFACKLQMPFFYVPGNHDVANTYQEKVWKDRFGRSYYHFVYKDVLFLLLSTDDPAPAKEGGMSKAQIAYVDKALKDNPNVRWTIVSVHKPLWDQPNLATNGWLEVERALQGRNYTVFAGHVHRYHKFVRQGMNYYQLATTGGGSRLRGLRYGEFDHIVWVTMKKEGPVLANLMLDGIQPENLKLAVTDEPGVDITNRKPTHPVRGQVFFEGAPVAHGRVIFYVNDAKLIEAKKQPPRIGDAIIEPDGSFVMSTYKAFDGAPVGEYIAVVHWREPWLDTNGRPGPSLIPDKYTRPETSGLTVQVKAGQNNVTLNLSR